MPKYLHVMVVVTFARSSVSNSWLRDPTCGMSDCWVDTSEGFIFGFLPVTFIPEVLINFADV